mgnify:CR=1 FL=1
MQLLRAVAGKWSGSREELLRAGRDVTAALRAMPRTEPAPLNEELLKKAAGQLAAIYDAEYGGFGSAPKFPSAHDLIFLQRYAYHTGDKAAKEELENTLRQMYKGGIYDHFGGGFARYSTDREWLAPHFEKTLYDNAMLALCYTEAWQNSRMALYRQVAEATLDYCLRELRADLLLLLCKLCLSGVLGLKSVFKISDLVGNARRITLHRVQTLTIQLGFVGQLIQFFDLGDQRIV